MYCNNCGANLSDESLFCNKCGKRQNTVTSSSTADIIIMPNLSLPEVKSGSVQPLTGNVPMVQGTPPTLSNSPTGQSVSSNVTSPGASSSLLSQAGTGINESQHKAGSSSSLSSQAGTSAPQKPITHIDSPQAHSTQHSPLTPPQMPSHHSHPPHQQSHGLGFAGTLSRRAVVTGLIGGTAVAVGGGSLTWAVLSRRAQTPSPLSSTPTTALSEPTSTPTAALSTPTPTPVPKGIVDTWRIIPYAVDTAKSNQEGYLNVTVPFAVENLGSDLASWSSNAVVFTMEGTVNGSNFTYNDMCQHGGTNQPPGYYLKYTACFTIPQVANNLTLIATPDPSSNQSGASPITWNVDREIKNAASITFPSTDKSNLITPGTVLSQPGIRDVILFSGSQLQRDCGPGAGAWWVLSFKMSLHNNYGDSVPEPDILVYDNQGNAYPPVPGFTYIGYGGGSPLNHVPPGLTHTAQDQLVVSSYLETPGLFSPCEQPNNLSLWPPHPKGLRFLVLLGSFGQAQQQWAVYDLGSPAVAPGIIEG